MGTYQMNLEKLSRRVKNELETTFSNDLPAAQREAILEIVQRALLDASNRTHREMKETAVVCCGPEADLAHKIQEEMDKKRKVLITNLMSIRWRESGTRSRKRVNQSGALSALPSSIKRKFDVSFAVLFGSITDVFATPGRFDLNNSGGTCSASNSLWLRTQKADGVDRHLHPLYNSISNFIRFHAKKSVL
jgi:hypothetical protein